MATVTKSSTSRPYRYAYVTTSGGLEPRWLDFLVDATTDIRFYAARPGIVLEIRPTAQGKYTKVTYTSNGELGTNLRAYLLTSAPSGSTDSTLIQNSIAGPVAVSEIANGWEIVFDDFDLPRRTEATAADPLYIYVKDITAAYSNFITVSNRNSTSAKILTSGDDTPPVIAAFSPAAETIEYSGSAACSWIYEELPEEAGEITSTVEYSVSGGAWVELYSGKNLQTSISGSIIGGNRTANWRVSGQTYFSERGAYAVGQITVKQALAYATPTYPVSGYVDRNSEIVFEWSIRRSTNGGTTVTGSELEYSIDSGNTWVTLGSVSGSVTTLPIPADFFPLLDRVDWRVRSINGDGAAGSWGYANFATKDADTTATIISPRDGAAMDETKPIAFNWSTQNAFGNPQSAADLQWITEDTGDSWVTLAHVSGEGTSYVAPANTFPGAVIYWRVRAYSLDGVASPWAYAQFSTLDTPSIASPVAPDGTIESTDNELLFTWSVSNSSGSASTGAELQYLDSQGEWVEFGTTDGATSLLVPGGTIPGGVVYWRVRSYNRNHNAGPWSAPVSFAAYAAPRIRAIDADSVPFATITWQVEGQLAYELRVDGKTYGPYFGDGARSFTMPTPLEDGSHTAAVRAQNQYGLWSAWSEIGFVTRSLISDALPLSVYTANDARLSWSRRGADPTALTVTDGNGGLWCIPSGDGDGYPGAALITDGTTDRWYLPRGVTPAGAVGVEASGVNWYIPTLGEALPEEGDYIVFRDGELLGNAEISLYTDRTALGEHSYQVFQRMEDNDAIRSNIVTVTVSGPCLTIGLLEGSAWIPLRLSDQSNREPSFSRSRQTAWVHYSGRKYPEAEVGEQEDFVGSFDASWPYAAQDEADAFEALLGESVVIKTRRGVVITGVLEGYDRRDPRFYKSYRFQVRQEDRGGAGNA